MKEQLEEFLDIAKAWEKMITPIKSVFVVKVPGPKNHPEKSSEDRKLV